MSDNEKKIVKRDPKGFLDKTLSKVVSRKLLVWATATTALFYGIVPPEEWINICLIYIGSQASIDMLATYLSSKNGSSE